MNRSVLNMLRDYVPLLGVILLLGAACAVFADDDQDSHAPGDLDPAFGKGGVVTSNPSARSDWARAAAADSSWMYVVGSSEAPGLSDSQWWIEKRSLANGSLDEDFGIGGEVTSNPGGGQDTAFQVAIDESFIYVVGQEVSAGEAQWRLEKRHLRDGSPIAGFGTGGVVTGRPAGSKRAGAIGVAIDSAHMYVIGFVVEDAPKPDTEGWAIEKRTLADGSLDATFGTEGRITSDPSPADDWPSDIAIDASSMYVSGTGGREGSSDTHWRVEKRSLVDGSFDVGFGTGGVVTSNPSTNEGTFDERTKGIVLDSTALYVVGHDLSRGPTDVQWRIEKRTLKDGALVPDFGENGVVMSNPSSRPDYPWNMAIDSGYLYVVGVDDSPAESDRQWRIEKRPAADGSLDTSFGTEGVVTSNPGPRWDLPRDLVTDSSFLYVVGSDDGSGDEPDRERRIEKRFK